MPELLKSPNLKSICIELDPASDNGIEAIDLLIKNFSKYEKNSGTITKMCLTLSLKNKFFNKLNL